MREPNGGHRSHNAGDDRKPTPPGWWDVPASALWRFTNDLCARLGYRGAAKVTGVSRAGLQKYVECLTRPNRSTRQLLGECYLERIRGGAMDKNDIPTEWKFHPRLMELLPREEFQARRELRRIFELARRFPDEVPACIDRVEDWLDTHLKGEWVAERKWSSIDMVEHEREWKREAAKLQRRVRRVIEMEKEEEAAEAAEREAKRKAREEAERTRGEPAAPAPNPVRPRKKRGKPRSTT